MEHVPTQESRFGVAREVAAIIGSAVVFVGSVWLIAVAAGAAW
jgi:hypothetical protein